MGWMNESLDETLSHNSTPWTIPTQGDVANLCRILHQNTPLRETQYYKRQKYRLSAAVMATHFLATLLMDTRCQIRSIVFNEDRGAIAWPECHGQGLIPYCQGNTQLHVERRVSLWRNALPAGSIWISTIEEASLSMLEYGDLHLLKADDISRRCLAPWILEALALPSLGMPAHAFALTLDGSPCPEKSSEVWNTVLRDAAWQTAFERSRVLKKPEPGPADWIATRSNRSYIAHGFPQAIRDITEGNSLIKCNFDTGELLDIEDILHGSQNWTTEEWTKQWWNHEPKGFQTDSPLPSWLDLRREDVLPR